MPYNWNIVRHRTLITLLSLTAWIGGARGQPVSFNGYYEGEFFKDKLRRPLAWNMWNPKHFVELKFSVHPFENLTSYLSLIALSNGNSQRLIFNQAHLELRTAHTATLFFSRQDRFWIDSPLLFLVNTERVRDDAWGPKAEGVRFDFWDLKGFSGTAIASKFKTFDGEAYIGRLRWEPSPRFMIGSVYLKKDWREGQPPTYNEVTALQARYNIRGSLNLRFEGGHAVHPDQVTPETSDDYAWELELRRLHIRHLLIAASVYNYGFDFIDEFSNKFNPLFDKEFDRKGFYLELIYMVPRRAINLVYRTRRFQTRYYPPRRVPLPTPYRVAWDYGELYVEFIGGLNFKLAFDRWKDRYDDWRNAWVEFIGENRFMRVKLQYKIRDIGINTHGREIDYSLGQRHLFGAELKVNLTDHLQFYGRGALAMGVASNWETLFAQLAYRAFPNSEIYLEYGEGWTTDADLVNDWDFSDNPAVEIRDQIRLLVKFWF